MTYDALVIGGGPAGSSAANVLASADRNVLVLERERFPRFHVGESLLPACQPLFERLGVAEAVARAGFVVKRGASFRFEDGTADASVVFSRGVDCDLETAYQVPRARLDELLLDTACERGASVWQEATARAVFFEPTRVVVEVERGERGSRSREPVAARYLIDASGQAGFLSKRLDLRRPHDRLRNLALYAHYEGVRLDTDVPAGDIQIVSLAELGWMWLIPLTETVTSVGLVIPTEQLQDLERSAKIEEFERIVRETAVTARQLDGAVRSTPVYIEADFSYSCSSYCGARWLLAGDAGSFLDPVFSTGVQLALEGGMAAGEAVSRCLDLDQQVASGETSRARSERRARRVLRAYGRAQRRRYEHFESWVEPFYRPAFRDLLCQPTERYGILDSVATVLAGETRLSARVRGGSNVLRFVEQVHRFKAVTRRLHEESQKGNGPITRRNDTRYSRSHFS